MEKEKTRIGVFTSPTCPHCPGAKELVKKLSKERDDVIFEEYSSMTSIGRKEAAIQGITSVPTIFVKGPWHHETIAFRGTPSKERLISAIDITQGRKKIDELDGKENFFSKIKSLFKG